MPTWSLDLYNLGGSAIATGAEFQRLAARRRLNEPGAIEIDLPWDASRTDWAVGQREIKLTRDGTAWWGGYLWHVRGDGRSRRVTAQGQGYLSRLRRRVMTSTLSFADEAQHEIAWDLIAHTQAQADGGLGFTQGTHTGGTVTRSRTYCSKDRRNIADAIEELAAFDDGFDFDFDPTDKSFDTWAPQKKTAQSITLTGSDELTLSWEEDSYEAASYVSAVGEAAGQDCTLPIADVSDATAATAYGRLHEVIDVDASVASEVSAAADEELRVRKAGLFRARCAFDDEFGPTFGSYGLGDTLTVNVADQFATFNRTFRILEIALELEWPDKAYWELELDAAVD